MSRVCGETSRRAKEDFIRLGVLGDWDQPYLTMDLRRSQHRSSARKNCRKWLPCVGLNPFMRLGGSALAEAEVEYQDKISYSIYVRYPVVSMEDIEKRIDNLTGDGPLSVLIWTTTPWTYLLVWQ